MIKTYVYMIIFIIVIIIFIFTILITISIREGDGRYPLAFSMKKSYVFIVNRCGEVENWNHFVMGTSAFKKVGMGATTQAIYKRGMDVHLHL